MLSRVVPETNSIALKRYGWKWRTKRFACSLIGTLGSAGCQPAVAGSLPATFTQTLIDQRTQHLGKLPR
jgi:hypothetical protein